MFCKKLMEVQTGEMAKCTPSSLPAIETLELDGLLETSCSSFIFSMVFVLCSSSDSQVSDTVLWLCLMD